MNNAFSSGGKDALVKTKNGKVSVGFYFTLCCRFENF